MKLMNEFVYYLTQDEDYSPHTIEIYSFSIKKYFEYANEVSVDNYKRFVRMLEDEDCLPEQYAYVLPHLNVSANG